MTKKFDFPNLWLGFVLGMTFFILLDKAPKLKGNSHTTKVYNIKINPGKDYSRYAEIEWIDPKTKEFQSHLTIKIPKVFYDVKQGEPIWAQWTENNLFVEQYELHLKETDFVH